MKILSHNYRGLARLDKKLALRQLLFANSLDIIFLQETLGPTDDIARTLDHSLPGWRFTRLDAHGRSGGLALGINTRSIKEINYWGGQGYLGEDVHSNVLGMLFRIINIYGPF